NGQQSAHESETRRGPSLQHPTGGGAEQSDENAPPGKRPTSESLPDRKKNTLRGWVHGSVGRLLQDMQIFKVDPHGMWRIGDPAVREGIGGEQKAELIVNAGLRNRLDRKNCDARRHGQAADEKNSEETPFRDAAEHRFGARNPR